MKFTDIFVKRPVLASVISLLILFLGFRALHDLPLRQFPKMENTVITITTAYPGASADLMQGFITAPLQRAIASADGIDYITAESQQSVSTIKAYIRLNFNPSTAMTEIMAKVAEVQNDLPKESNRPVIKKETGSHLALMYIGYSSKEMNNQQITDYLTRVIQPKLQTVDGVASADILGGLTYAMRIWLDTEKMAALNVTTADVMSAIQTENFQTAAGQTKGKYVLFNIDAKTGLNDVNQFNDIVIKNNDNTLIHIKDVATVELGAQNYDSSVTFDGKNAVFIGINGTPTSNPLTTIDNVKKVLPEIAINYPPAFEGKIVYDSTEYIRSSLHEVIRSITEASLIVILVIFLFLGTLRSVIIPVITIPLSLIGVCFFMYVMGYSLNLLTLLAMVLAIGLVVDDAIVVVENIYRHIENGKAPFQAALMGAREIASPIISMTTTLAAVYAPIGLMTGLTGALFKEFAFTLAFSVILSGIIALTLSPMMCSKLLNASHSENKIVQYIDLLFEKFKYKYAIRLRNTLNTRSVVLVFAACILLFCGFLALTTAKELAPEEDQSVLFSYIFAPQTANMNYLTKFTNQLNQIYKTIPETQDYFIVNGMGSSNFAMSGLILKPWDQRSKSQKKIQKLVQTKLGEIPGLMGVAQPLASLPGSGDLFPIQLVITSTADYLELYQLAQKLQAIAKQSGLFLFVDSDLKFDKPELVIDIDRNKAASLGISMQTIGTTLAGLSGGNYINRFSKDSESYQVIPQLPDSFRSNPEQLNNIYIPTGNSQIPLSTIMTFHTVTKPSKLTQFQQLNSVTLQAMLAPGTTIPEGLNFLRQEGQKIFAKGSITFDYAGASRQAVQEGSTLIYTFLFALLIIYLVLSAQFESFTDPLIILISVPMSITGALLPLNLGIATLNIYTGIGLITLIGLISKHGILLVEFANKLQVTEGLSIKEAIIKSSALRLRPIIMTTAAMVLGVFPLIFASGAGAKSRFDIGLVISFGMLIGTCFTLFVVPTIYTFLAKQHFIPHPETLKEKVAVEHV